MNYFVYIALCNDSTYYIGYTNNLEKRFENHNLKKGAKYTRGRTPIVLKYFECFETLSDALKREYQLKKLTRKEKHKLVKIFDTIKK